MDFYSLLSKLLIKANDLQNLDEQKGTLNHFDKKEYATQFLEKVKSFIECKIECLEENMFRLYYLEYLKDLISDSLSLCPEKEQHEINNNIRQLYKNLNINNNNNEKRKNEKNYTLNNNNYHRYYNYGFNNKVNELGPGADNELNNTKEQKIFYHRNYSNNNYSIHHGMDKSLRQKINEKTHHYNLNDNKNHDIFSSFSDNVFFKSKKRNNLLNKKRYFGNSKKESNEGKNIINNYYTLNNINAQMDIEKNGNSLLNSDNCINNSHNIMNKNVIPEYKRIEMNDEECMNEKFNNDNYKVEYNNNRINEGEKFNDNYIMQIKNKTYHFQQEINYYYQSIYKTGIIQFFIKSIYNKKNYYDLNKLFSSLIYIIRDNIMKYMEQNYIEKLITLFCLLYPFAKGHKSKINDYIFKSDLPLDQDLFHYLRKSIFIKENTNLIDFTTNQIQYFRYYFLKDLQLKHTPEGKNMIISIYTFIIIFRCLRKYSQGYEKTFFDKLLKNEYLIMFKIHFILEHQELYNAISDDFIDVYNGLQFINVFYSEIFCENNEQKRIMRADENNKYIFGKEKFLLSSDKTSDFDIELLFSEDDNKIYKDTINIIENFYNIEKYNSNDINDLIYFSTNKNINDSNFIFNIVEHICEKREYIYKDINHFKKILIKLETKIFNLGREALNIRQSKIEYFSIDEEQKEVFYSLYNYIKNNINPSFKHMFNLYPYGSTTQFLGGKKSDIDIYLDIRQMNNNEKIDFLYNLRDVIAKIIKVSPNIIVTTRLCIISFKYRNAYKTTEFDINLMGLSPYMHSALLRAYSLMDPRFSLLAVSLKKFIEVIEIKNTENRMCFLNSFSWMILLITFLQDIIKPQILPKILSYKSNSNIYYTIEYGENNQKIKNVYNFIENIKEENTFFSNSLNDSNFLFNIYQEQINKNEPQNKNNLSCAEIFLYFLEFIIYYFKSDSVYVNCSIENEGYESIKNILIYNDNINKKDDRFSEYFKNKYYRARHYYENRKTRDGMILIRDPVDPHYNPGHTLKIGSFCTFINNLKKGYINLLKHGDFDKIIMNDY